MKKLLKEMQLLFGNAPPPASFDTKLKTLEEPLRQQYRLNLCRLAFGYYDQLPGPFRKFTAAYLKHDRELYIDYLLNYTPLAKLRYTLHNPELFLPLLYVLENADHRGRVMYHQLASSLLLAFSIPYKLETLDNYLCHSQPDADTLNEFLALMGKVKVESD
ncbi:MULTISPECIES: hypothetical protein [Parabacteroides]|uniref:hypothetical protein n=1 Tax=Parabacteroides leei TaxID=2939491 RepID=UPI00189B1B65|nr:hypothetical protein [Parabacteroides goldsteinii]